MPVSVAMPRAIWSPASVRRDNVFTLFRRFNSSWCDKPTAAHFRTGTFCDCCSVDCPAKAGWLGGLRSRAVSRPNISPRTRAVLEAERRLLFRRQRGDDFFETRIAAQWVPKWKQLQVAIAETAWVTNGCSKLFASQIVVADPSGDYRQILN